MPPLPFEWAGGPGHFLAHQPFSDELVPALAAHVARSRLTRGELLATAAATRFLIPLIALREREVFTAVYLDPRLRVIAWEELFVGSVDGATVHPRELARAVLGLNAAAVLLAHNHPSGHPEPSRADLEITGPLVSALGLIDMHVLDPVVLGGGHWELLTDRAAAGRHCALSGIAVAGV